MEKQKQHYEPTIVDKIEQQYPEMTAEFKAIQKKQYELFCHKQHDYGSGNISVGTNLETDEDVDMSLKGLWFRMNDKIQRSKNLLFYAKKNAVEGETINDAWLDLSNYGIMSVLVHLRKWGK